MRLPLNLLALARLYLASASSGLSAHRGGSGDLPDSSRTPGDTLDRTQEDVCKAGSVRL
jgi:hypothetical protein